MEKLIKFWRDLANILEEHEAFITYKWTGMAERIDTLHPRIMYNGMKCDPRLDCGHGEFTPAECRYIADQLEKENERGKKEAAEETYQEGLGRYANELAFYYETEGNRVIPEDREDAFLP